MDDDHRERTRETERTTIVHTGDGGSGGGTVLAVVLVLILIAVLLFVAFGGWLGGASEEVGLPDNLDVNINVDGPDMQMPDLQAPEPEPPADEGGNSS